MSFPKVKMEGICHLRMTHLLSFLFFKHTTVFNTSEPLYSMPPSSGMFSQFLVGWKAVHTAGLSLDFPS